MLQGRADDVVPGAAGGDAPGRRRPARHLRRVGPGSWGDTDLSHLPAPPTAVADLPVPTGPRPPELAPDPGLDWWRSVNKRGTKHVAGRLSRSETIKSMVRGTVARRKGRAGSRDHCNGRVVRPVRAWRWLWEGVCQMRCVVR